MVFWIPAQSVFRSLSINIKGIHSSRDLNLMWIIAVNHWPNASVRHVIVVSIHNSIVLSSILPHINVTQDSCLSLPSFLGKLTSSFTQRVTLSYLLHDLCLISCRPDFCYKWYQNHNIAELISAISWLPSQISNGENISKTFKKTPVIWCIILFKIEDIKGI